MIVNVNQKRWTLFGKKYIVSVNKEKKYKIEREAFSLSSVYKVKDYETSKEIGEFHNKLRSIKANAEIIIGNKRYSFIQDSVRSMKYICEEEKKLSGKYVIQANRGYSTSIFKGQIQVGQWIKRSFVILEGNKYQIEMNFDEDPILFSIFAVMVDNYRISITIGGDIGWELGNIGKGLTNKNENWEPKKA